MVAGHATVAFNDFEDGPETAIESPADSGAKPRVVPKVTRLFRIRDLLEVTGDWQERASCAQVDPEAFFPEKGASNVYAKRVCGSCAVKAACLEYALGRNEQFGIWGGMTERERRKLKRRAA